MPNEVFEGSILNSNNIGFTMIQDDALSPKANENGMHVIISGYSQNCATPTKDVANFKTIVKHIYFVFCIWVDLQCACMSAKLRRK